MRLFRAREEQSPNSDFDQCKVSRYTANISPRQRVYFYSTFHVLILSEELKQELCKAVPDSTVRLAWGARYSRSMIDDLLTQIMAEDQLLAKLFPESAVDPKCNLGYACIPIDEEPKWSVWVEYDLNLTLKTKGKMKGFDKGTYYVCSAVLSGGCMSTSETYLDTSQKRDTPQRQKKCGLNEGQKEEKRSDAGGDAEAWRGDV
jgi:hypothetical protein